MGLVFEGSQYMPLPEKTWEILTEVIQTLLKSLSVWIEIFCFKSF